jgi:hypothetical protein
MMMMLLMMMIININIIFVIDTSSSSLGGCIGEVGGGTCSMSSAKFFEKILLQGRAVPWQWSLRGRALRARWCDCAPPPRRRGAVKGV